MLSLTVCPWLVAVATALFTCSAFAQSQPGSASTTGTTDTTEANARLAFQAYCNLLAIPLLDCEAKFNANNLEDKVANLLDTVPQNQLGGAIARKAANECIRRANLQDNTALMQMFQISFDHKNQIDGITISPASTAAIPRPTDGSWYSDEARFRAHWIAYVQTSRELAELRKVDHSGVSGLTGLEPGDKAGGSSGAAVNLLVNIFNEYVAWEKAAWVENQPWIVGVRPDKTLADWPIAPIDRPQDFLDHLGSGSANHHVPSDSSSSGHTGGAATSDHPGSFKPTNDDDFKPIPDDVSSGSGTTHADADDDEGADEDEDDDADSRPDTDTDTDTISENDDRHSGPEKDDDDTKPKPDESTITPPEPLNPDIVDIPTGLDGLIDWVPALSELGGMTSMQLCQQEVETELWKSIRTLEILPDSDNQGNTREEAEALLAMGICDPQFFDAKTCREFADKPIQEWENPDWISIMPSEGDIILSACPVNVVSPIDCGRASIEMQQRFHFNQMGTTLLSKVAAPGPPISWLPSLNKNSGLRGRALLDLSAPKSGPAERDDDVKRRDLPVMSEKPVPFIPDLNWRQPLHELNRRAAAGGTSQVEPGEAPAPRRFAPSGTVALPLPLPTIHNTKTLAPISAAYTMSMEGHDEL